AFGRKLCHPFGILSFTHNFLACGASVARALLFSLAPPATSSRCFFGRAGVPEAISDCEEIASPPKSKGGGSQ
ncbi:MAG: hypothetical protein Q7T89_06475, partial [Anaerolineales bacterium]|nr:hypothetical protein [Anaerolineales bacterium]